MFFKLADVTPMKIIIMPICVKIFIMVVFIISACDAKVGKKRQKKKGWITAILFIQEGFYCRE